MFCGSGDQHFLAKQSDAQKTETEQHHSRAAIWNGIERKPFGECLRPAGRRVCHLKSSVECRRGETISNDRADKVYIQESSDLGENAGRDQIECESINTPEIGQSTRIKVPRSRTRHRNRVTVVYKTNKRARRAGR